MAKDYKKLNDYLEKMTKDDFTKSKEEKENSPLEFYFQSLNKNLNKYNNNSNNKSNTELKNDEKPMDKANNFLKRYAGLTYDDFLKNSLPKKAIGSTHKNKRTYEGKDSFNETACPYIAALSDVEKNGFDLKEIINNLIEEKDVGLDLKKSFFLKKGLMYLKDNIKYNIDDEINTKDKNFSQQDAIVNMYLDIKQKLQPNKNIYLEYDENKIGLILDRKIGFDGYEDLFVTDTGTGYQIKYFGTLENALSTFSEDKINNEQININPIIYFYTLIKNKSKRTAQQSYKEILDLKKKGNFDEAMKALDFFVNRFNEKE